MCVCRNRESQDNAAFAITNCLLCCDSSAHRSTPTHSHTHPLAHPHTHSHTHTPTRTPTHSHTHSYTFDTERNLGIKNHPREQMRYDRCYRLPLALMRWMVSMGGAKVELVAGVRARFNREKTNATIPF